MTYPLERKSDGSGFYENGTVGEAVTRNALVYQSAAGNWQLADADAVATMPVVGLSLAAIQANTRGKILKQGYVVNNIWTWTAGGEIYASTTPGVLTQTAPAGAGDVVQVVAMAINATTIDFNPAGFGGAGGVGGELSPFTAYVGTNANLVSLPNYFLVDGVADDVQINAAEAFVTALGGGTVILEQGTYVLVDPIIPTGNQIWYKGQGRDTFLNGDGLLTTEHAFHVTARTNIKISDMSIQTQDGSGKASNCILIEDGADNFVIDNVIFVDSAQYAIFIGGTNIEGGKVVNCHIFDSDNDALIVSMDGGNFADFLDISHNTIDSAGLSGIFSNGTIRYSIISNNLVMNSLQNGIYSHVVRDSTIADNIVYSNGQDGILVSSAHRNTYSGNVCYQNVRNGIRILSSDDCTFVGNTCNENDDDGIQTNASDDNLIHSNTCNDNDRYGINVSNATSDRNSCKNNILLGNTSAPFNDAGTDTKLAVKPFQFTEAIVGAIVVTSPTGVDVDATTEGALAWGQLPEEIQQIVRLKIWGVATDAPIGAGGQMHVEVIFNAGASNAAYNEAAKSWTIANHDGEEVDYVANDVVHWVIEDGDVGNELLALVAGDIFEIFAMCEVGADPDGATDCLFRVVEVEYV